MWEAHPLPRVGRCYSLHFENALDLDGNAAGQRMSRDRAAGPDPRVFAEHVLHQFRETVDHFRLIRELHRAVHPAKRLDDALHFVERADHVADGSEDGEPNLPGRLLALVECHVLADAAEDMGLSAL